MALLFPTQKKLIKYDTNSYHIKDKSRSPFFTVRLTFFHQCVTSWYFTDWFTGVFSTVLWPVLGFLFLPVTTLWYSVVIKNFGGQWTAVNIIVIVLAIVIDMGSWGGGYKSRNRYDN